MRVKVAPVNLKLSPRCCRLEFWSPPSWSWRPKLPSCHNNLGDCGSSHSGWPHSGVADCDLASTCSNGVERRQNGSGLEALETKQACRCPMQEGTGNQYV